MCVKGKNGDDASTDDVKAGESGEPGTYGLDEIMFCSGPFSGKKTVQGKFETYLI